MRLWFPASLAVLAMLAGCQAQPKPTPSASVLDVTGPRTVHQPSVYEIPASVPRATPASYAAPAYLPPGEDSNYVAPPNARPAPTPAPATVRSSKPIAPAAKGKPGRSAGKTYLVMKGDTLFRIAKEQLGSGGQWRRIAEVNPGLTPATLKAGQKLVMP